MRARTSVRKNSGLRWPAMRLTVIAIAAAFFLALVFGLIATKSASGQEKGYETLGSPLPEGEIRKLEMDIRGLLRGNTPANLNKTLGNYYVRYIVGSMTHPSAWKDPSFLPELRKTAATHLYMLSDQPQIHRRVRDLLFTYAGRVATGEQYSPIARYNAMLLLGELNEREMNRRSDSPPVPYSRATTALVSLANKENGALKVGALIGLSRHAKLQAAKQGKVDRTILKVAVDVLKDTPTDSDSADELHWMKKIAVGILSDSGLAATIGVLGPMTGDGSLPMFLRTAAAESIGELDFSQAKVDHEAVTKNLGQLAIDSLMGQIEKLQQYALENPGGMRPEGGAMTARAPEFGGEEPEEFGRGRGDRGRGGREERGDRNRPSRGETFEDPFVTQIRRQLLHDLLAVDGALTAIRAAGGAAAAKNKATSVQNDLKQIIRVLNVKGARPDQLFASISEPAVRLDQKVKQL